MSKFISKSKKRNKYAFELPDEYNESRSEISEARENRSGSEDSSYVEYVVPYDEYENMTEKREEKKKSEKEDRKKHLFFAKYLLTASLAVVMVADAAMPSGSSPFSSGAMDSPGSYIEDQVIDKDSYDLGKLSPLFAEMYKLMQAHYDISLSNYIRSNEDFLLSNLPKPYESGGVDLVFWKNNRLSYYNDLSKESYSPEDAAMLIRFYFDQTDHTKGQTVLRIYLHISDNVFAKTQTNLYSYEFDGEIARFFSSDSFTYQNVYCKFVTSHYSLAADGTVYPYDYLVGEAIDGFVDGMVYEYTYPSIIHSGLNSIEESSPENYLILPINRNRIDFNIVKDKLIDLRGYDTSDYGSTSSYFLSETDYEYGLGIPRNNPDNLEFYMRYHYFNEYSGCASLELDQSGTASYVSIREMLWAIPRQ